MDGAYGMLGYLPSVRMGVKMRRRTFRNSEGHTPGWIMGKNHKYVTNEVERITLAILGEMPEKIDLEEIEVKITINN